ncbi:hypothetical protein [Floridanema evergladense]|uniref:Uncharacterized protein n=1 Tax=Floridaenema evergladense BLCC-F167 TaxID=3153639 RepID=A0ABV4WLV1_9CYAN
MLRSNSSGSYNSLPHHITSGEIHWHYSDYYQETFRCNSFLANLESPLNLGFDVYCGLTENNIPALFKFKDYEFNPVFSTGRSKNRFP